MTETSYDQLPYTSHPFAQTHPDRLATVAALLGMQPAPVEHCRVLELGCAGGGNLAPMACSLPHSDFVGLDASARQIADGQTLVQGLGLTNITLTCMDIMEMGPELGQFDYIIAHGVYSWVPSPVQDKILTICRQNLAENGVSYISYNTYPGWRLHEAVREMMLYHARRADTPVEQIAQARDMLDFLAGSILADSTPHANFLHSYVNYVRERFLPQGDDAYLFHNELAEVNEPVYFYQFAERAAQHSLRYLGEAEFQSMLADNLPAEVTARLRGLVRSTIELEQYMDFLRNRTFRQTLLCRQEVELKSKLSPDRLAEFYMASSALPANPHLNPNTTATDTFRAPAGKTMTTDHPLTKAVMLHLSEAWPQAVSFNDLLVAARARLNGAAQHPNDAPILGANLLKAYCHSENLVEFHKYQPPLVRQVSERPAASPMARYQAQNGAATVTNLRHEMIKLEGLSYHLLPYLDGRLSRPALVKLLAGLIDEGVVEVQLEDPAADIKTLLPELVESALRTLAQAALLIRQKENG